MSYLDDQILSLLAGKSPSSTGWYRVECPFCEEEGHRDNKGSLSVSALSGFFTCWRCGEKGRIENEFQGDIPAPSPPIPQELQQPDWWEPLAVDGHWNPGISIRSAVTYWRKRVGSKAGKIAQQIGVGACLGGRQEGRIVVPMLENGRWMGWIGRDYTGRAKLKYVYPPGMARVMFNRAVLGVASDDPVLVVEGVFDAVRYWPDVVACLGKPSHWQIEELAQAKRPVVIALDGDAWEEGWALHHKLKFTGTAPAYGFVQLPPGEDPGSVEPGWLRQAAKESI